MINMKKRGMVDQVFIYIFVVIVIAFIFLFGLNMIKKLGTLNEQGIYVTFKTDFKDAVDEVYYKNPGSILIFDKSSRNKPLLLPKEIEEVCFESNKVVLNSGKYPDFTVDKLYVASDFCADIIDGKFPFKMENVVINNEVYAQISEV